jgi:8-oxo-dGTP pyrophosphatase MutT (NUDIX family)
MHESLAPGDCRTLSALRRNSDTAGEPRCEPVGETHEACALHEVEEETGLRCVLGRELATTAYRDGKGRPKIVRYWMMDPDGGVAGPRNEADGVRGASLEDAAQLLTYPRARERAPHCLLRPGG